MGSFTISTWKSATTDTVDVTASTSFVEPGVAGATFANVCVGDYVGAAGNVSNGTVAATKVFIAPVVTPPKLQGAFGTVTSVNGSTKAGDCGVADMSGTFGLSTWKNAISDTVNVSPSTTFTERGVTGATFANVCVGDLVGAVGNVTNGTVTATKVFIAPVATPNVR